MSMTRQHLCLLPLALLATSASGQSRPVSLSAEARHADSLYDRRDYAAAARAYRAALTGSPNDGRSWYRLGASLASVNDNAAAAEAFERSAAIGHQMLAMYNAAAMRARLGQRERALAWIDSSLAAGFSGDSILRNDPDFGALHGDSAFQRRVDAAERAFRPCRSRQESHVFDFWIGEWDVTNAQSFNAYNTDFSMWQQFWTDQYGRVTEYRESERTKEGGLRFLAHQRSGAAASLIRMTFTPIDERTVRQFGETSTDGGKRWATSFDLYYHRKQ